MGRSEGCATRLWKVACIAGVALVLALGVFGCRSAPSPNAAVPEGTDPALANFAPTTGGAAPAAYPSAAQPARVLGQRTVNEAQQQAEDYTPQQAPAPGYSDQGAPAPAGYPEGQGPMTDDQAQAVYDADLTNEQASEPPPALPDYEQPPCPEPNDLWTPGYWAWAPGGYYWVPGVWVAAPYAGALWTPGYWGFLGGLYRFHHGFWSPHIGFYGGVDYGNGYVGHGYYGGYWNRGQFFYNTAVNRVNVNAVRNVYVHNVVVNNTVVNNRVFNRVSYVGGRGGLNARPLPAEVAVMHEQRLPPMQSQLALRQEAAGNRAQFYQQNHGRPQVAADARPVAADRALGAPLPRPGFAAPAPGAGARPGGFQGREQGQPGRPGEPVSPPQRAQNAPVGAQSRGSFERQGPQPSRPEYPQGRPGPQPGFQNRPAAPNAQQPARPDYQRPQSPAPQSFHSAPQPERPAPYRSTPPEPAQQPRVEPQPAPGPHGDAHPQHPSAPARGEPSAGDHPRR